MFNQPAHHTVLSIGSSVVDIVIGSKQFELETSADGAKLCQLYGQKLEVENFQIFTGGGGSNTAVGFSRLGFETQLISEAGKDVLAELLLHDLQEAKVGLDHFVWEKSEQTGGSVILVGSGGERAVMVYRGAAAMLDPNDIPKQILLNADWVHLSSIAGRHSTLKTIFYERQKIRRLSWNPGKAELELLACGQLDIGQLPADVLLLNEQEWLSVYALRSILTKQIPIVVITSGAYGGKVIEKGREKLFSALPAKALDVTGAGDAFATAFVAGLIWKMGVDRAIELGKKNSASVVEQFGAKAGLLNKSQLFSP